MLIVTLFVYKTIAYANNFTSYVKVKSVISGWLCFGACITFSVKFSSQLVYANRDGMYPCQNDR